MGSLSANVNVSGKIFTCWHVVGNGRHSSFAEKGDSGAWAIDGNGVWVGLLFAAPELSINGDAYVFSADVIVRNIEKVTGGTVSLVE